MLKNLKNNRNARTTGLIINSSVWNTDNDRKPTGKNLRAYFEGPFSNKEIKSQNRHSKNIKNKHIDKAYNVVSSWDDNGKQVIGSMNGDIYKIRSSNYVEGQAGARRAAMRAPNRLKKVNK